MVGALQYLESQRDAQPELADWYNALADLYQRKLWHQLTVKLEQFVALAVVQVVPCCYSVLLCSLLGFRVISLFVFSSSLLLSSPLDLEINLRSSGDSLSNFHVSLIHRVIGCLM